MPRRRVVKLVLAGTARFGPLHGEHLDVQVGGASLVLPLAAYRLLLGFRAPATVREVFARPQVVGWRSFQRIVARLEAAGLLVDASAPPRSIEALLRPEVAASQGALRAALAAGKICVIRDAVEGAFAGEVAAALRDETGWQHEQGVDEPFFHYSIHVLTEPSAYGGALLRCHQTFTSEPTRAFMSALCGLDCAGPPAFGASVYLPGDYAPPHSDDEEDRTLAWVWHLTSGWQARWGGQLFWCPSGTSLTPTFNTLVLFRVTPRSMHVVCPVLPATRARRLTVNGWWTRARPLPAATGPPSPRADWFQSAVPPTELAPGVLVF
jgi:hypothetical protein